MVTVLNAGATTYVVSNLKKYTKYEFFLVPFYKSVEGQPSNSQSVQTLEDGTLPIANTSETHLFDWFKNYITFPSSIGTS